MKASHLIAAAAVIGAAGFGGFLAGERSAAPLELRPVGAAPADLSRRASASKGEAPALAAPAAAAARTAPSVVSMPPVNSPVAAVLDDLKKEAAAGNSSAACRVAFELDRCHNVERVQRSASNFANLAQQSGLGPELVKRYNGMAEREQARAFEARRLCLGVPKEETADAWRYLLQAARAGHGPSMARYANRSTLWDEDPIRVLDGLIAFRAEGAGFLNAAAQLGYPEAYEQLAFAQINGMSLGLEIPVDRVKGVAYYLALMRTATPEESARLQRAVDYAVQKENLSADDLARARTLAEPLAAALLRRHAPGSVEFSGGTFAGDNGSHCEK